MVAQAPSPAQLRPDAWLPPSLKLPPSPRLRGTSRWIARHADKRGPRFRETPAGSEERLPPTAVPPRGEMPPSQRGRVSMTEGAHEPRPQGGVRSARVCRQAAGPTLPWGRPRCSGCARAGLARFCCCRSALGRPLRTARHRSAAAPSAFLQSDEGACATVAAGAFRGPLRHGLLSTGLPPPCAPLGCERAGPDHQS